jgi:predicted acyl esterase
VVAGPDAGQRKLNGPQTTGRRYTNLSEPQYGVVEELDRRAPMRDGEELLADVLRPDGSGTFPALVTASPYPRQIQNTGAPLGFVEAGSSDFFVPRGYAHVIANLRGTGGSGGTYGFFDGVERGDMHDLVEWAAAQPWCDGNVGMVGISAFAITQLEAAVEQPAHLRAIFPVAVSADLYEAMYHGGVLSSTFATTWLRGVATLASVGDRLLRRRTMGMLERVLKSELVHGGIANLNGESTLSALGKLIPSHYERVPWDDILADVFTDHQTKDAYWAERNLIPLLRRVTVPTYLGCDWDNVPMHLPATFSTLEALPDEIPVRVALPGSNGLSWPWESLHVEALAWFDHWLKERDTGIMDGPPIRYVMPGADHTWRTSSSWPPEGVRLVSLVLRADGRLRTTDGPPGSRSYFIIPDSLRSRRADAGRHPSALTWETPPLAGELDIAGPVEVVLVASITTNDTAWIVTLQDVDADGATHDVTAGWLRASMGAVDEARSRPARPVHQLDRMEPIPPDEPVSYRIGLVDTVRRFKAGHRVRIVLRSDDSTGEPAIMGFRHQPLGIPSRNVVHSASRLVLSVLGGSEALDDLG